MGQSFGTVSNVFYVTLLGTVLLNVLYMAAGVSALVLLRPR